MDAMKQDDEKETLRAARMIRLIGLTVLAGCSAVAFVGLLGQHPGAF